MGNILEHVKMLIIIMVIVWSFMLILLYSISLMLEIRIVGNNLLDQVLKLLIAGTLFILWLYIWYNITSYYRRRYMVKSS